MVFTYDTRMALAAAVWLSNSAGSTDELADLDALTEYFDRYGYTGAPPTCADLAEVSAIRPRLRELFVAGRDAAVPLINGILAEASAVPRLVRHGDVDWHIHATTDDGPLADRILVETAMAMIDVVRADEMGRLGRCAAEDCDDIVLDLSRNRSRKYCSPACTNRSAVAAYRSRRSAIS